jgi:hypothetical protein
LSFYVTDKEDIMSFQAYIDNVKSKTGKTPEDFAKLEPRAA